MAAGDVAPVNVDLMENYANVFDGLKNQPHNSWTAFRMACRTAAVRTC